MIAPTVLPSGELSGACRRVDPRADEIWPLWWILTYRDGTVRRQYEVRGDNLIQCKFGLLPRAGVLALEVMNGPPWDCVRQWRIDIPLGAEAEIHYDGAIVLSADVEIANKRRKSGTLILPSGRRTTYRINRHMTYTFGWHLPGEGIGEYLHVAVDGDQARAWANHVCYV